jgi:dsRNA-specific ribonuclease
MPKDDMPKVINRIIGHQNLDKLGRRTKIESMIRPKAPLRASKKHNIFSLLKEDAQGEDPSRTIARAIKAIIGAVYYDGGLQAAQRVMSGMDLILKPPQR